MKEWVTVIFQERQGGKTRTIMEEIHEYAVQNRTAEIAVICANRMQADVWIRNWRDRYPALRPPRVVSMQNVLPLRGYRFEKLYFEDIEHDLEGIYSDRVLDVVPTLAWARDPEVVFTCSPLNFTYDWPYEPEPDPEELARIEAEEKAREKRLKDALMLGYMRMKIRQWRQDKSESTDSDALDDA